MMRSMLRSSALMLMLLAMMIPAFTQAAPRDVQFTSKDGLTVSADYYQATSSTAPLILMFHQARSSRGEYRSIAPRIVDMGYNVLAVDLRAGGTMNEVENETWKNAVKEGKSTRYSDSFQDMEAALAYARQELGAKRVIVWGSSYSASLAIVLAAVRPSEVAAVVAFSPGEYFGKLGKSETFVREYAGKVTAPVFITSARSEADDVQPIYDALPSDNKELYTPLSAGQHGAKALWPDKPGNETYWLATREFLRNLPSLDRQTADASQKRETTSAAHHAAVPTTTVRNTTDH